MMARKNRQDLSCPRASRRISQARQSRFHAGLEGAQIVGKDFGKHRQHRAREIHRHAAPGGLPVQWVRRTHVMRNVRNRHNDAPTVAGGLGKNGVVEIARVGAVDGHQRQLPQVFPLSGGWRTRGDSPGMPSHPFGPERPKSRFGDYALFNRGRHIRKPGRSLTYGAVKRKNSGLFQAPWRPGGR